MRIRRGGNTTPHIEISHPCQIEILCGSGIGRHPSIHAGRRIVDEGPFFGDVGGC